MAVGYHKINTSAARSRRRAALDSAAEFKVTPSGTKLLDPIHRNGVTKEDFVSDSDNVKCEFDSGVTVVMKGRAVRCGIESYDKNR